MTKDTFIKSGLILGLASLALLASCYSSEDTALDDADEGADACCDSVPDAVFDTIPNDVLPVDPPAEDPRPDVPDLVDVPVDTLIEDVNPVDLPPDEPPDDDCEYVTYFQCGFMAQCVDGVVTAEWHEHVFYDDVEDIVPYVCSHECGNGCDEEAEIFWPSSGAELVDLACL